VWDWVKGDLGDDAEIWAGIEALDFHLPADQALALPAEPTDDVVPR